MSSKILRSLSDENPDLHKHIGCMNGILQLFDRRQLSGQTHKRLSSGHNGNSFKDSKSTSKNATEVNIKKTVNEKNRISTESSRTSFSSSCSSSLSSIECNRASLLETCSFSQTGVTELQVPDSRMDQPNSNSRSSYPSPDLRDFVKDSIYREPRGLLVKTVCKGENGGQTLKYFDSPRPMQQPKASGLKESYQVLQSPSKSHERNHVSPLKDARRYSCDGRESRDMSKSGVKLKELPRLSLDSRAGSIRESTNERKSDSLLGNSGKSNGNTTNFAEQQEEPESRTRLSNVVARLMGLEAFPDSMSTIENQTRQSNRFPDAENSHSLGVSRTTDDNKQTHVPVSPRNLHKEPLSSQLRNDSVKKPLPSSKFPIETAPWKQPDGSTKGRVAQTKPPNTCLSVYGEIEKRLTQLEFNKSGKDLRALKQILEAMHKSKERLETRNEPENLATQRSDSSLNLPNLRNPHNPISALPKNTNTPKSIKSSIVIMKPRKVVETSSNRIHSENATDNFVLLQGLQNLDSAISKESIRKRTSKESSLRTNNITDRPSLSSRLMDNKNAAISTPMSQNSKGPHSTATTTGSSNSDKVSATFNERQVQKKLRLEKQTRPADLSSDSIRSRRQSSRQPTESGSPRRKPRARPSSLQPSDDDLSDIGGEARDLRNHTNSMSLQSKRNSLASQVDEEVSSIDRSDKINNIIQQSYERQKPVARLVKDRPITELTIPSSEQPSPVSVLDAAFYVDDLPSPIKKKSIFFKDDQEWNPADKKQLFSGADYSLKSEINHKTAENTCPVIQSFIQLLSAEKESILGKYSKINPEHQYISEILLASGFLNELESRFTPIHLRQTGYPIIPDVFLALEQVKASMMPSNDKETSTKASQSKLQSKRKLVFDVVNEILTDKFLLKSPYEHCCTPNTLANRGLWEQKLLGELCYEVDRLQGNASNFSLDDEDDTLEGIIQEDLRHQSTHWTTCSSEIPGLVLDVERLIFKDLITEVVTSEGLGVQSDWHCKQRHSK